MLRITKLTDYALLVLASMDDRMADSASTARGVADRTRLPHPTVSKVLKQLARASLVVSERGKLGGYRLARGPDEISLVEVIDAVEGPVAVTECTGSHAGGCEQRGSCALEASWQKINEAIRGALASVTLAGMARGEAPALIQLGVTRGPADGGCATHGAAKLGSDLAAATAHPTEPQA